jgi:hypothetical protein
LSIALWFRPLSTYWMESWCSQIFWWEGYLKLWE